MKMHKNFIDYNPIFRFAHYIQTSGIYRHIGKKSFLPFRLVSIILGPFLLKKVFPILKKAWIFLYCKEFLQKVNMMRWALQIISYMGDLFLDVTFNIPKHTFQSINQYVKMENYNEILDALQEKKGVLIPFIHMGEIYHPVSVLVHTKIKIENKIQKNEVVIIASKENEFLFQPWLKRCNNLFIPVTSDFKTLSAEIEDHLNKNRCVFIMQDYFNHRQLRVPFIYKREKYKFLIPCPQLLTYLYFKLGTPVVPCHSFPQKDLSRSLVKFFPRIDLLSLNPENESAEIKEDLINLQQGKEDYRVQNGLLSLKINQLLYPYALKYPFYWQMSATMFKRSKFRIDFNNVNSYYEFYFIILQRLNNFMEKSYEPGRKYEEILDILNQLNEVIKPMKNDPNTKIHLHKKYIEIRLLTTQAAFKKVSSIGLSKQNQYIKLTYPKLQQLFLELNELF